MKKVMATMFSNPAWKLSQSLSYPNTLGALNYNGSKIGALAVLRGRGRDFPLSKAGLEYLIKMEQEGRIAEAQVSLWTRPEKKGEQPEFIAIEKATVVRDNIGDTPPQDGEYGPYWWITVEFKPAASSSSGRRYDPDEIF